jgi:hypothetical protein
MARHKAGFLSDRPGANISRRFSAGAPGGVALGRHSARNLSVNFLEFIARYRRACDAIFHAAAPNQMAPCPVRAANIQLNFSQAVRRSTPGRPCGATA